MNEDAKDGLYKQQTAVEWLAEKYNYITWMRNRDEISVGTADEWRIKYLEQAKEMDKQQKMDAYNQGYRDGEVDASNPTNISKDVSEFSNAENYIKETYGNNK